MNGFEWQERLGACARRAEAQHKDTAVRGPGSRVCGSTYPFRHSCRSAGRVREDEELGDLGARDLAQS